MIKSVKLYMNSNVYEIMSDITSEINMQSRNDLVFATGSFDFRTNDLNYNIPPYTPCIITMDDDTKEYYMASSEAHYDYINKEWLHSVEIMDASSRLATWILDAKTFSTTGTHTATFEQMAICIKLIELKYNVSLTLYGYPSDNYIENVGDRNTDFASAYSKQIEKSIPNGSQLWTALCMLANDYDSIPTVTFSVENNVVTYDIRFSYYHDDYILNENNLIDSGYYQNSDEYNSQMEASITDAVDRTTKNRVDGLTVVADGTTLRDSSAYVLLPSKVESIDKMEVRPIGTNVYIDVFIKDSNASPSITTYGALKDRAVSLYLTNVLAKAEQIVATYGLTIARENPVAVNTSMIKAGYHISVAWNDAVEFPILEKSKWDTLAENMKPRYCYYKKYDNKVENLYSPYRMDLWDIILQAEGATYGALSSIYSESVDGHNITISLSDPNPLNYSYNFEFRPCVSLYLVDDKTNENILNETAFKTSATTYNGSANIVDFDRVADDLSLTNNKTGRIQNTFTVLDDNRPKAGQRITYKNVTWYITSVISTYNLIDTATHVINCALRPTKIADAIGLETQFESTPNPLESAVSRHIYTLITDSVTLLHNNVFILFEFKNKNNELIKRILKQGVLVAAKNDVYLVAEALDNYAIATYSVPSGLGPSKRYVQDAVYVDEHNEFDNFDYKIINITGNLTQDKAYMLPMLLDNSTSDKLSDDDYTVQYTGSNVKVFKDAREKLIFTFKLTNCTILHFGRLKQPVFVMNYTDYDSSATFKLDNPNSVAVNYVIVVSTNGTVLNTVTGSIAGNNTSDAKTLSIPLFNRDYNIFDFEASFTVGDNDTYLPSATANSRITAKAIKLIFNNLSGEPKDESHLLKDTTIAEWVSDPAFNNKGWERYNDSGLINRTLDLYAPGIWYLTPNASHISSGMWVIECKKFSEIIFALLFNQERIEFNASRDQTWSSYVQQHSDYGFSIKNDKVLYYYANKDLMYIVNTSEFGEIIQELNYATSEMKYLYVDNTRLFYEYNTWDNVAKYNRISNDNGYVIYNDNGYESFLVDYGRQPIEHNRYTSKTVVSAATFSPLNALEQYGGTIVNNESIPVYVDIYIDDEVFVSRLELQPGETQSIIRNFGYSNYGSHMYRVFTYLLINNNRKFWTERTYDYEIIKPLNATFTPLFRCVESNSYYSLRVIDNMRSDNGFTLLYKKAGTENWKSTTVKNNLYNNDYVHDIDLNLGRTDTWNFRIKYDGDYQYTDVEVINLARYNPVKLESSEENASAPNASEVYFAADGWYDGTESLNWYIDISTDGGNTWRTVKRNDPYDGLTTLMRGSVSGTVGEFLNGTVMKARIRFSNGIVINNYDDFNV